MPEPNTSNTHPIFHDILKVWTSGVTMPVYKLCPGGCGANTAEGMLCESCADAGYTSEEEV